jgi:tRNA(Ile)-lysidine synthase
MNSDHTLPDKVATHCAVLFPRQSSILVAVSGGGDSTALLLLLHSLKKRLDIKRIGVIHVNHGLRGTESDEDESFVEQMSGRLEAPFYLKKLSGHGLHDRSIEAWARNERYLFFHEVKARDGYEYIATGHTADDQAETVLFRLMRGTGLRGLRGVLAQREDGVIRPLLGVRRRELQAWLKAAKVPFRHDSSNNDCAYDRNRIRHKVLPLINNIEAGASEKLARIAIAAQEFWENFGPGVEEWTKKNVQKRDGSFLVGKEGFEDALHASEGLRSVFEEFGIPVDAFHLDEVSAQASRTSGSLKLPGGWHYFFRRDAILFCKNRSGSVLEFSVPIVVPGITECPGRGVRFVVEEASAPITNVPGDNVTGLLDRDVCGDALTFRSWKNNDRFQPLGSGNGRSVPVREFLAKQKIAAVDRPATGVVEGKDGLIVWVPGIRINHACRMTEHSRKLLKISYQSCPPVV